MTPDLATDVLAQALGPAAEAAGRALPATASWDTRAADPGEGVDGLLPYRARAVTTRLEGFEADVTLVVSGPLAERALGGPEGDLAATLVHAMNNVATALANLTGAEIQAGELTEVDAEATLAAAERDRILAAGILIDGGEHHATLAIAVDAPVVEEAEPDVAIHEFAALDATGAQDAAGGNPLELLNDVEMGLTAELGRTKMFVREILGLTPGAVIELDRTAGSPVDVLVNGTLIARGEVVVIDEEFGIRVTEIIGYEDDSGRHRR